MMYIHQVAGIAMVFFVIMLLIEGRRSHNNVISSLTYDNLGNCYVNSIHLRGQCLRYQQCLSAVQNWQYYQQIPSTCYYNTYDYFVCCPEAYVDPRKSIPAPPPPQLYYPAYMKRNWPIGTKSTNSYQKKQRISEQECFSIYNERATRHRHHRSKRSTTTNYTTTQPKPHDETSLLVEGDIIEKQQVCEAYAVGGILTSLNEFPYMCALGWRLASSKSWITDVSYNCGCVLIARKYVLTAGHCASFGGTNPVIGPAFTSPGICTLRVIDSTFPVGESPFVVRLGGGALDERDAEVIKIRRVIQHPEYDPKLAYNDIAIIKLEKSSRAIPACLWSNEGLPQEVLTAIGYGQIKFAGPSSNTLLKVFLKVLTNKNCNTYHKPAGKLRHGIMAGQICAGDPQGKMDTCQGDSGGPLLMNVDKYNTNVPYIVGLTSFGEGCASGVPSVYTRISHYIDWIEAEVWK